MPELIRGQLGTLSLSGVLNLIESERLTCWLRLGDQQLVGFLEGVPVYARTQRLSGLEAMVSLFFHPDDAPFLIDQDLKPHGDPIGPVFDLVMEGCRRRDLWERQRRLRLRVAPDAPPPPAKGFAAKLVAWMDGQRSLAEITRLADLPPSMVVDPVHQLIEQGHLIAFADSLGDEGADELMLSDLLPRRTDHRLLGEDTIPPDASVSSPSVPVGAAKEEVGELDGAPMMVASFLPPEAAEHGHEEGDHGQLFEDDEDLLAALAEEERRPGMTVGTRAEAAEGDPDSGPDSGEDLVTEVEEASGARGRGRDALNGTLVTLGLQQNERRDTQGRAFLAWAMKKALEDEATAESAPEDASSGTSSVAPVT